MQIIPGLFGFGGHGATHVRAFMLQTDDGMVVLDTLFDTNCREILDQIKALDRSVEDVKHIILTHGHRSHLGGLARLAELSGAQVYGHEWEADIIAGQRAAQNVSWVPHRPFRTYPFQVGNNLNISKHRGRAVDHFIHAGDQIGPLTVVFAPGHSPGHLAFWWSEKKVLFAGDAITTWPRIELGWRGFLLNPTQHMVSIRHLAEYDAEVLCSGHGDPVISDARNYIIEALAQLD